MKKVTFRVKFMKSITKNFLKKFYVYVNFNNFWKCGEIVQVHTDGRVGRSWFFRNFF